MKAFKSGRPMVSPDGPTTLGAKVPGVLSELSPDHKWSGRSSAQSSCFEAAFAPAQNSLPVSVNCLVSATSHGDYSNAAASAVRASMRVFVMLAAAILLAGCTDADWGHVISGGAPSPVPVYPPATSDVAPTGAAPRQETTVSDKAVRQCVNTADQRADDILYQDMDAETMQRVRDATYSDCMAWATHLKL
jgi:hypothetical protein